MLKNIPHIISPDLMYCLMSMGHGDEIVIADGKNNNNNKHIYIYSKFSFF